MIVNKPYFQFLNEVVEHSNENRMSYENLAIVIGPNIMPVESKKSDKAKELEHERRFIDAHTKIMEVSSKIYELYLFQKDNYLTNVFVNYEDFNTQRTKIGLFDSRA